MRGWRNQVQAYLYVTDIETDEIIYMSDSMKQGFCIQNPEGKICWKVLQEGMEHRCPFCPVPQLLELEEDLPTFIWKEENTRTGRIYENCDSLIRWGDGRKVHLQHSMDATEYQKLSRYASVDELTGFFNRRVGREYLQSVLRKAAQGEWGGTVCLYDLNGLKLINDRYGHTEGDRVLVFTADRVKECLNPDSDYGFRLSGDEFVLIFGGSTEAEARSLMETIQEKLKPGNADSDIPYEASFSYGLMEIRTRESYDSVQVFSQVDEEMYKQKRAYHIRLNQEKLKTSYMEEELKHSFHYDKEHLYDALVQSTDDYIYIGNLKTGTFRYAPSMVKEFDLPGEIVPHAAAVWGRLVHPHDKAAFLESNQEVADGRTEAHHVEYRALNRQGQWVWLRCRGHMIRDEKGSPDLFAGMITNLGDRNKIDHVTGIFNKFQFEEEVKKWIREQPEADMGLMLLGMDDFKHINDLYDRTFGDEVLRITAQKITTILSSNTELYRLNGDEFGIIIRNLQPGDFERTFNSIHHTFQRQQEYNNRKYYCTLSAGCVAYPLDGIDYLELEKFGNYSLEYAKVLGKDRMCRFSSNILKHKERDLLMTELLRESVEKDFQGFQLHYQPQVDAASQRILGAEALARWECPALGMVPPGEFIPLLEKSSLIIPVGKWIFEKAVEQCETWCAVNPGFTMSINLSYLQILDPEFLGFVRDTVESAHLPAHNLVVELTETMLVKENEAVRHIFEHIQKMGLAVAMDDFGTGYSSLGVLKNTPVDIVKIDKTFVSGVEKNAFDATFIRFIVALCHDVKKEVCLEGVETEAEYQIVKDSGLEMIQGYYFGRPVDAETFAHLYLQQNGTEP